MDPVTLVLDILDIFFVLWLKICKDALSETMVTTLLNFMN